MTIAIEILLILIMAAGVFVGIKVGFIKMAARPVKFILALILAFSLCTEVADSTVTPVIDGPISNYVTEFLYENCTDVTAQNAEEELPTLIKFAASLAEIDLADAAGTGDIIANLADVLVDPVVRVIAIIISFIAIYILSKIALALIFWFIGLLFKGGLLGFANKLCGVVFASFIAFIASWAVAVLIEFVIHSPLIFDNPSFSNFEGGFFYRFFNEYNPMELLLSF